MKKFGVRFDLILMDMNYGRSTTGEDGIELLRKTKIFQPETPVILITARGKHRTCSGGNEGGGIRFCDKALE